MRDHNEKPLKRVLVRVVESRLLRQGGESEDITCSPSAVRTHSSGIAVFVCNTVTDGVRLVVKVRRLFCFAGVSAFVTLTFSSCVFTLWFTQFETVDSALPAPSQASLALEAVAYHSPNQRYLYIDPPLPGRELEVGHNSNLKVYSATPSYVPIHTLSYLVRT